ncbi:hypothetical protein [Laspinema olomoucense]|nr:hypothetical protein [Laspinema sp. D3c]MCT7997201.1 hypothetical protein [Laspinema sp. D3c]
MRSPGVRNYRLIENAAILSPRGLDLCTALQLIGSQFSMKGRSLFPTHDTSIERQFQGKSA